MEYSVLVSKKKKKMLRFNVRQTVSKSKAAISEKCPIQRSYIHTYIYIYIYIYAHNSTKDSMIGFVLFWIILFYFFGIS